MENQNPNLPAQQQEPTDADLVNALAQVHAFFTNFDRVPGALCLDWGNRLNQLAAVANHLSKRVVPQK